MARSFAGPEEDGPSYEILGAKGGSNPGFALGIRTLVRPEQLPLKLYTTAERLACDGINRIVCDSPGFLWFAKHEGLSRFDGYQFINYTAEQGLPQGPINDLLETAQEQRKPFSGQL